MRGHYTDKQEDKNYEYMEKSIFIYGTEKSKNGYFISFAAGNVHIYLNWTVYLEGGGQFRF